MPQQIGTLLKKLFDKAGIDSTQKEFTDLLAINATVGDEAFNKVSAGIDALMDVEGGKNNNDLHGHFKARILAPIDNFFLEQLDALGVDDGFKSEFKSDTNTYNRMKKLLAKAQELTEAKHKGQSNTGDTEKLKALQTEIGKLQAELVKSGETLNAERTKMQTELEAKLLGYDVDATLGAFNFANKEIDKKVNIITARTLLNEALASKGAKMVRQPDGTIKLYSAANPDLEFTENHKPVPFGDFVSATLASSKIIEVTDPNRKPVQSKPAHKQEFRLPDDQVNEAFVNANADNLAALEASLGR